MAIYKKHFKILEPFINMIALSKFRNLRTALITNQIKITAFNQCRTLIEIRIKFN